MSIPSRIYLDYNATTPLGEPARWAIRGAAELWGNPSSVHAEGQAARAAIERARRQVGALVGAAPQSIVFTSGATESINWVHQALVPGHGRLLTTVVEHPAVLGAAEAALESSRLGAVTHLAVDDRGRLSFEDLDAELARGDVALVSIMWVNNEIGTIYPIAEIARRCRRADVLLHTDATQGIGRLPPRLVELDVDLASFSSHKLYGPKGVGALYIREGLETTGLLHGGHQERGRRPGTENLLGIIGFGAAAAAADDLEAESQRQRGLRDRLRNYLLALPDVVENGDADDRAPNTLNVSFLGCPAETVLMALDLAGVSVSAGSACSAGSLEPSHVLLALTDDTERHRAAVRFSLGRPTTETEIDEAADRIERCIDRLRSRS